jgi:hypothetical protein
MAISGRMCHWWLRRKTSIYLLAPNGKKIQIESSFFKNLRILALVI